MSSNIFWYKGPVKREDHIWLRPQPGFEKRNAFPIQCPTLIIPIRENGLLVAGYYRDFCGRQRLVIRQLNLGYRQKKRLEDFTTVLNYLPQGARSCLPKRYALSGKELILEVETRHESAGGYIGQLQHLKISLSNFSVRSPNSDDLVGALFKETGSECVLKNGAYLRWAMAGDIYSAYKTQLWSSRDGSKWHIVDTGVFEREYRFTEPSLIETMPDGRIVFAGVRGKNDHHFGGWVVGIESISRNLKALQKGHAVDIHPSFTRNEVTTGLESVCIDRRGDIILAGTQPQNETGADQGFLSVIHPQTKETTQARFENFKFRGKRHQIKSSYLKCFVSKSGTTFIFGRFTDQDGKSYGMICRSKNPKNPFLPTLLAKGEFIYQVVQGKKTNEVFAVISRNAHLQFLRSTDDGKLWTKVGHFTLCEVDDLEYPTIIVAKDGYFLVFTRWSKIRRGEIWWSPDLKKWSLQSEYLFPTTRSTGFHDVKYWNGNLYIQGEADIKGDDRISHATFLLEVEVGDKGVRSIKQLDSVSLSGGRLIGSGGPTALVPEFPVRFDSGAGFSVTKDRLAYAAVVGGFGEAPYDEYLQTVIIRLYDWKTSAWSSHYFCERGQIPLIDDIHVLQNKNEIHVFGSYVWGRW